MDVRAFRYQDLETGLSGNADIRHPDLPALALGIRRAKRPGAVRTCQRQHRPIASCRVVN
ncbi:hypothetical protein AGR6A_pa20002 [Agrobacterium sp. NCPPB 925]|nr:hypothetical protein AGR6A_pa20002 [Agrobacterium sp. NCPPB 925]